MSLTVKRTRFWWAVFEKGERVSAELSSRYLAESALERILKDRRAARHRIRPCLCCGQRFRSEGPHNRLCAHCRAREGGLDQQMMP